MPIAWDQQTPEDKEYQTIAIAIVSVVMISTLYFAYKKFK